MRVSIGLKSASLIILLLITQLGYALDCSQNNITIASQSDIDNFQSLYGAGVTCDKVVGDLLINNVFDSNTFMSLTNLDGLSALREIGGDLEIGNNDAGSASNSSNSLVNIQGLSNLESVGGYFFLTNNSQLSDCKWVAQLLGWPSGQGSDFVGNSVLVGSNKSGCNSVEEVYQSATEAWPNGTPEKNSLNQPTLSGLYYDPNNSGHGFDFNVLNEGLIVYYYGHTTTGQRLWLISGLYTDSISLGEKFEIELYEILEGSFGHPVEPASYWGTVSFELSDIQSGSATLEGIDGRLDINFIKLAGMAGVDQDQYSAELLFTEDFDRYGYELRWTGDDVWDVTGGDVDIIGDGTPYETLPIGNGRYIDLDGFGVPGLLKSKRHFEWENGAVYKLEFELAGSGTPETVEVMAGPSKGIYTIPASQPLNQYQLLIVGDGSSTPISFLNTSGGDKNGPLLDIIQLVKVVSDTSEYLAATVIEKENNDQQESATNFRIDDTVIGSLWSISDVDWFTVDVDANSTGMMRVEFDVSSSETGWWSVYWYDPAMEPMSGRNIDAPSGFEYEFPAFTAGKYRVRIQLSEEIFYSGGLYRFRIQKSE